MINKSILSAFLLISSLTFAKEVKVSVMPEDTKIFVDGVYVGDGLTTVNIKKKEVFIVLKLEKEVYEWKRKVAIAEGANKSLRSQLHAGRSSGLPKKRL